MKQAKIYTDGGARGNPGPAGIGVVIETNGKKFTYHKFIGTATNNQAEYLAVIFAFEKAKDLKIENIDLFLDSELVCNQLKRVYKVKDKDLGSLFVKTWNAILGFKKVNFFHVPRKENKEADFLVNKAIDEKSH